MAYSPLTHFVYVPAIEMCGKFFALDLEYQKGKPYYGGGHERVPPASGHVSAIDLATGKTRPLDNSGGACWPNWSPDGKQLANVLLAKEPSTIQVRNADGSGARELGDPKRWSYYPDWSKDGKLIALSVSPQHHEGEDWDLAIVSTDGSRPLQKLTTGPGNDRLPDWKP